MRKIKTTLTRAIVPNKHGILLTAPSCVLCSEDSARLGFDIQHLAGPEQHNARTAENLHFAKVL